MKEYCTHVCKCVEGIQNNRQTEERKEEEVIQAAAVNHTETPHLCVRVYACCVLH